MWGEERDSVVQRKALPAAPAEGALPFQYLGQRCPSIYPLLSVVALSRRWGGGGGIISLNFSTDSCFATSGRDGSSCEKLVAQNFKKNPEG